MYSKAINVLGNFAKFGVASMFAIFLIGAWATIDFFFIKDTYESKKALVPELVIKHNDTTFVYILN